MSAELHVGPLRRVAGRAGTPDAGARLPLDRLGAIRPLYPETAVG